MTSIDWVWLIWFLCGTVALLLERPWRWRNSGSHWGPTVGWDSILVDVLVIYLLGVCMLVRAVLMILCGAKINHLHEDD